MRRLKVVHLTSVHVPSDTRILYRECASLAEAGYEVVLIAAQGQAKPPAGVRIRFVPAPRNRFERMTRTVRNVYHAAVSEKADVYHFHDPELMGVGLLLRMRGARVVFDVHEDIPEDIVDKPWIPGFLRGAVSTFSALTLRVLHRCYSAIVTATPAIAQRFPNERTVVVNNYPRTDELPPANLMGFAQRPKDVLYLGAISELRCINEMVRAMKSAYMPDDVKLVLAGTFEDGSLQRRIQQLPGWERVRYVGYCTRDRVPATLSSSRAGLLLFRHAGNHEDAMPNKLFEYLGAGLPVIISSALRCSQIVLDNDCGIVVDPDDIDGIARAIATLVNDPALAQAMGQRGSALVRERYQWTTEALKLTSLYARIA